MKLISKNGVSRVSLSEADLVLAIKMFLDAREHFSNAYTVSNLIQHKKGSNYAVTVEVYPDGKKREHLS